MAAYIKRAKEVNVLVNAIVGEQYDKALRRAQELDQTLDSLSPEEIEEQFSEAKKPLLGVPLSVKEAFEWTGKWGSLLSCLYFSTYCSTGFLISNLYFSVY